MPLLKASGSFGSRCAFESVPYRIRSACATSLAKVVPVGLQSGHAVDGVDRTSKQPRRRVTRIASEESWWKPPKWHGTGPLFPRRAGARQAQSRAEAANILRRQTRFELRQPFLDQANAPSVLPAEGRCGRSRCRTATFFAVLRRPRASR